MFEMLSFKNKSAGFEPVHLGTRGKDANRCTTVGPYQMEFGRETRLETPSNRLDDWMLMTS